MLYRCVTEVSEITIPLLPFCYEPSCLHHATFAGRWWSNGCTDGRNLLLIVSDNCWDKWEGWQ